jgi:hypothetical protein
VKSDIGRIIIMGFACLATFLFGTVIRHNADFRKGYIACLLDIQNNEPMRYVLKKQADGETRWVENTEVKK